MRDRDRDSSLFNVINNTYTSMGMRLLQQWLLRPTTSEAELNKRYDAVSWFVDYQAERSAAVEILSEINDIERIVGRVALGIANGRDAVSLMSSLHKIRQLAEVSHDTWPSLIAEMYANVQWHDLEELTKLLHRALAENPPVSVSEGGLIRDGYSEELDELRKLARGGKEWLTELESRERAQTGIQSLKIGYNKVFGYYIEVSHANTEKVPPHFIRRQTLANAERYITPELKEHEDMVLEAQARIFELEYRLFKEVLSQIVDKVTDIQNSASFTALVDVLVSFAETASMNSYTRPEITKEYGLEIHNGRHPVVGLMSSNAFVPNDTKLDSTNRMMIITGANMAGKSTYIRQVALLVIMEQSGSFVPAERMRFGLFDQIHTRIGAMDNLVAGLSTFMVEMVETAYILNNVNDRSLVVLDEIGRGTSTYDGLSIAWSVAEHLIQHTNGYVLFATHYHELTELSDMYENINNFHMAVTEQEQDVIFLYRIAQGSASQSYGIEVAKRAGIPSGVIKRSREVLTNLTAQARAISPLAGKQLDLFGNDMRDND
jgi:DNA mismatch repair protein MutS